MSASIALGTANHLSFALPRPNFFADGFLSMDPDLSLSFPETFSNSLEYQTTRITQAERSPHQRFSPSPATSSRSLRRASSGTDSPPLGQEESMDGMRLTKTGRISKALKGRPVHSCPVCGKVYTRNEHLRRHQLNHGAQALKCDFPGCEKDFRRPDLLERHKEEHTDSKNKPRSSSYPNQQDEFMYAQATAMAIDNSARSLVSKPNEPTLYPQLASPPHLNIFPDRNDDPTIENAHTLHGVLFDHKRREAPPDPRLSRHLTSAPTLSSNDLNEHSQMGMPVSKSISAKASHDIVSWSGPEAAIEPTEPFYFNVGHATNSPGSVTSPAPQVWRPHAFQGLRNGISPTDSNQSPYFPHDPTRPNSFPELDLAAPWSYHQASPNLDDYDRQIIKDELARLSCIPSSSDSQNQLSAFEDHYLLRYWKDFDPLFPIIHRPTFEMVGTSPIVKALMIAIGAQYHTDATALSIAVTLREVTSNLLAKRQPIDYHTSRLWDLQAVFLAEVLAMYCSRRPLTRLSSRFEDLRRGLQLDRANLLFEQPLDVSQYGALPIDGTLPNERHIQWVHTESKQRLLLSTYVIEVQYASLFGIPRDIAHGKLPMPCSDALWRAESIYSWLSAAQNENKSPQSLSDALSIGNVGTEWETFLVNVAIAYYTHAAISSAPFQTPDFLHTLPQTPQALVSYHAALIGIVVPVRSLLAVSGETFVLGQKLATREQFIESTTDLRNWLSTNSAAQALHHAHQLITLVFRNGSTGVLHETWALYMAALVCWGCRVWPLQSSEPHGVADISGGGSFDQSTVNENMLRIAYAHNTDSSVLDVSDTKTCMAWVRQQVMGRVGGLLQDAVGVLDKLLEGRIIDSS